MLQDTGNKLCVVGYKGICPHKLCIFPKQCENANRYTIIVEEK